MASTLQTSADTPTPLQERPSRYATIFVCVVVFLNLIAIVLAWRDRSWDALGIVIFVGPMLNLGLAVVSSIAFLLQSRPSFSLGRHLALSFGVPVAATIIDAVVISAMGLYGG